MRLANDDDTRGSHQLKFLYENEEELFTQSIDRWSTLKESPTIDCWMERLEVALNVSYIYFISNENDVLFVLVLVLIIY